MGSSILCDLTLDYRSLLGEKAIQTCQLLGQSVKLDSTPLGPQLMGIPPYVSAHQPFWVSLRAQP